jgi:predicted dehydrogenase
MTARRVAIVGAGGIAEQHVRAINANADRARLVAIVDVEAGQLRTFGDKHRVPGTSRYTHLIPMLEREQPDLVCVATPPALHTEQAIQCLEAGAWVLCEKPLCGSLSELDRIMAAEERCDRHCASVFQWRFGSAAQHLQGMIRRGELGRPLVGLCQTTWYRDEEYYRKPWRGRWDTELGGVTLSHGIHALDLFMWLFGDWLMVSAMIDTLDRPIEVEDVSVATVRFASGALGSVVSSVLSPREETYVRLDFQKATVEVRALYSYTNRHWTFTPAPGADAVWRVPVDDGSGHHAQLRALLEAMDSGVAPPAGTADVRPTLELLSSLYRSAAEGEVVRRGDIRPGDPFYSHVGGKLSPAQSGEYPA